MSRRRAHGSVTWPVERHTRFVRASRLVLLAVLSSCNAETTGLLGPEGGDDGIPTGAPLRAWLADGTYEGWVSEPAPHPSAGPHFGDVRTFFSPSLVDSLEAGDDVHPVGAAAVKELFGSGDVPIGWAVMIKVGSGSDGGSWYWYERYDGSTLADEVGLGVCVDCHRPGDDFVLSALP